MEDKQNKQILGEKEEERGPFEDKYEVLSQSQRRRD